MAEHLTKTNRGTWIAHALVSAGMTLIGGFVGGLLGGRAWAMLGAVIASVLTAIT